MVMGFFHLAGGIHARNHPLRRFLLLRRLRKDGRPVLRAGVVALAVERCGIVQLEEPVGEQRFIGEHRVGRT